MTVKEYIEKEMQDSTEHVHIRMNDSRPEKFRNANDALTNSKWIHRTVTEAKPNPWEGNTINIFCI